MSGKGAKGLTMGKSPALSKDKDKDKDKKKPISRSSRAGLQVSLAFSAFPFFFLSCPVFLLAFNFIFFTLVSLGLGFRM